MTGDNQDVLEFLNQTKSMYDEDSANYRMCEQAIAAVMGVQKAAKKLSYIHQCIDLYCDREELHDESYWLDYILDPEWIDTDIGWVGNETKPTEPEYPDHTAEVSKMVGQTAKTTQNVPNDDLVSRKAEIEAINTLDKFGVDERSRVVRWCEGLEPYVRLRDVVTSIANLPSAQLYTEEEIQAMQDLEQGRTQGMIDTKAEEVAQTNLKPTCKQLATDTISRRAAIDAVKKNTFRLTFAEEQNCEGHVAWSAEAIYSDVIEGALLELPSAQPDLDSAYTEGYTQAEAKYRALWDEMQANIKEKAFGKRKGLIHTADIDSTPTIDPKPIKEGLLPDGTLHLFTDTDLSKVDRVWVSQNGTHYGDLYYADGEPKIGRWINNSPVTQKCNQCGFVMPDWDCHRFKYCPNCSARMVQEGEDNERA